MYSYTDPQYDPFLENGLEYTCLVTPSIYVPSLNESIIFPECSPYITNIDYTDTLSFDGFDVTWEDYCGGFVYLRISSHEYNVYLVYTSDNDGHHSFTASNLSGLNDQAGEYYLAIDFRTTVDINELGYDPLGEIRASSQNVVMMYIE